MSQQRGDTRANDSLNTFLPFPLKFAVLIDRVNNLRWELAGQAPVNVEKLPFTALNYTKR